jgi:hypothetical protein
MASVFTPAGSFFWADCLFRIRPPEIAFDLMNIRSWNGVGFNSLVDGG